MDSSYVNVMETRELAYVLLVYVLHGAIAFAQAGLAGFLFVTGSRQLAGRKVERSVPSGILRVALGLALVAPLAIGVSVWLSISAATLAFAALLSFELRTPAAPTLAGRLLRRSSVVVAAVAALFMLWEGEDNLALGADLLLNTVEFRDEEVSWQRSNDPASPKVGEVAPDFELQDPAGKVQVRLSDFRGKRPVALVFGSYT
jgi:hypothetical protein